MGPLEAKLGVLALAEVLTFLHGTARMAHCGLSPWVGAAESGCGVGWRCSGWTGSKAPVVGGVAAPGPRAFAAWAGALLQVVLIRRCVLYAAAQPGSR